MTDDEWNEFDKKFQNVRHELKVFMNGIEDYFMGHPDLQKLNAEKVHSSKKRLKDRDHLRDKLDRKNAEGAGIVPAELFTRVTDLAGVRLLLLFQADFADIDQLIRNKIEATDWVLGERAKAFTWDPESAEFFGKFDLEVINRPTSYTSVHYLIKPRADSPLCCELQVRTLFEEIWGEVDHRINYPVATTIVACKEQIRVLSKIVGAGSRLVDSIQRSIDPLQM